MGSTGVNFSVNLPVLNGKNYDRWRVQMKAIMGYQEVAEIVEEVYPTNTEGSTEAQKVLYRENKKKDCKAIVLIHQCINDAHFEKIAGAATS